MLRSNGVKRSRLAASPPKAERRHGASARNLGYDVVILKDCVGSRNRELHDMALKLMEQTFFEVATAGDIAAIWNKK